MRSDELSGRAEPGSLAARARRAQIIQAAAEVVAEVGYASASLARIAGRVGISKGVITYHFDSKDEIMRLVALQLFERCREHIDARIGSASSAAEQVRAWTSAELEFFAAHRTEFLAMNEIMANHRDPDFSHAFDAVVATEASRLAEILTCGQRDDELRAFDAHGVALIIIGAKNGVLDSWAHDPGGDLNSYTSTLLDFIDHAITAKG